MIRIRIPSLKLTLLKALFIGIEGSGMLVKGALELLVIMGTPPKYASLQKASWWLIWHWLINPF